MPSSIITGAFSQTLNGFEPYSNPIGPFTRGGKLYVFAFSSYPNDPLTGLCVSTSPLVIACYRSTDGGATWAVVDGVNSKSGIAWDQTFALPPGPPNGDPRTLTCQRLGNSVFVAYYSPASVLDPAWQNFQMKVRVAEFNLVTETWVAAVADTAVFGATTGGGGPTQRKEPTTFPNIFMAVAASGLIYIAASALSFNYSGGALGGGINPSGYAKLTGGVSGVWTAWTPFPNEPPIAGAYSVNWLGSGLVHGLIPSATDGSVHVWYQVGSGDPSIPPAPLDTSQYFKHFLLDDGTGIPAVAATDFIPQWNFSTDPPQVGAWWNRAFSIHIGGIEYVGFIVCPQPFSDPSPQTMRVFYSSDQGATWASDALALDQTLFFPGDGSIQVDIANSLAYLYLNWDDGTLKYITWAGPGLLGVPTTLIPSPMTTDGSTWSGVMAPPYGEPFKLDGVVYGAPTLGAPGDIGLVGLTYLASGAPPPTPAGVTYTLPVSSGYRIPNVIPNVYDCCLFRESEQYRKLNLRRLICPMIEDWDGRTIPGLGREFMASFSVLTPAAVAGNVVVLDWHPGPGEQGLIYGLVFWYTGTGFVPGSGDILWRLKVGRAWVSGLGNVALPLGSPGSPWGIQDYIPVEQSQRVQIIVQVPNLSGLIQVGTSYILAQLQGWVYPQY